MLFRFAQVFTVLLILATVSSVSADSLWKPTSGSLFTDLKARQVGDLVTVLISESSASTLKAGSDFNKSVEHSNNAGIGPFLKLIPEIGFSSEQSGKAGGQSTMSNQLVAKVTASVTQVLTNGVLEIQAQRTLVTNGEKQEITLTGHVRPEDIEADNTLLSTYLADVQINFTGKGAIADRQKEGVITKLIRFIF